jgi:Bacterial mobilisation protein (MobC)
MDQPTQELQLATERDVAMASLLVDSAWGAQLPLPASRLSRRQYEELLEVMYDVRRRLGIAGNNINQLARMANTTGELPAEARLTAGLEDVRSAIRVVHNAIDLLPRA